MGGRPRIVLDGMGGDHAPREPVLGAVEAARELDVEVVLVGRPEVLEPELARAGGEGLPIRILPAREVIEMDEHPAQAVRRKKEASILVGLREVKEGRADAFVSAGHSGAVLAGALLVLGRVPGIHRPALATVFPGLQGPFVLLDVGANTDCKPEWLVQFAQMGAVYARHVLGVERPRVALLSNGEEEIKGNRQVQEARERLRALLEQGDPGFDWVGNVEGKDLPHGLADVVVADGFVGNVVIKTAEGVSDFLLTVLRQELTARPWFKLAAAVLRPAFRRVKKRLDYAEYGGAPLLGVRGVVIVAHGRSNARAIRNAVRVAARAVREGTVAAVTELAAAPSS